MNIDELKYAVKNLVHRKMRSFLSVLSILIGITAIFAIISFGLGMQDYIDSIAEESGADKLFIQARGIGAPGTDSSFSFTQDEVDFVGKIKGVEEIMGMYMRTPEVEFKKQKKYYFAIGFDPEYDELISDLMTVDIMKGRKLKKGDIDKVVLGSRYNNDDDVFRRAVQLGDRIKLNGNVFTVVGFYDEIGSPPDDANIYMTDEGMITYFPEVKDKFGYAMIRAEKGVDPNDLAEKIQDKLRKYKGQEKGKEDFYVQTYEDVLEIFGNVINIINGILVLIAFVSVVVAAVNIMNTMYTSVLERTKEIGIMKSIGAKNKDILIIFMIEAGLLGMVGGAIGVILGYALSKIGGYAIVNAGYGFLQPVFPLSLTIGCLLFAFAVGALSGLLPAIQASKLKPVDALHYE